MPDGICSVNDCERPVKCRALCPTHYARLRRNGDPGEASLRYVSKDAPIADRLTFTGWDVTPDGCWEWRGHRQPTGYGVVGIGKQRWEYAHRASYTAHKGLIAPGLHVCHSCDNPPCMNPAHLFLGDAQANRADSVSKRRHVYGERSAFAVLSNADVQEIREQRAAGVHAETLAQFWGVSAGYIIGIGTGRVRTYG